MVLLLIKIDLKADYLDGDVIRLKEILNSIDAQEGYCSHSVNWDHKEQLLLVAEWKSAAAIKRLLQTDDFKLLIETAKTLGKHYAISIANVLSSGGIELAKEQSISPLQGMQGL